MNAKKSLGDLPIYILAMEVAQIIWDLTTRWETYAQQNMGNAYLKSADAIAINIAGGHGRKSFKENRNFCLYARSSILETKAWTDKARQRKLIDEGQYKKVVSKLKTLFQKLNDHIKSLEEKGFNANRK